MAVDREKRDEPVHRVGGCMDGKGTVDEMGKQGVVSQVLAIHRIVGWRWGGGRWMGWGGKEGSSHATKTTHAGTHTHARTPPTNATTDQKNSARRQQQQRTQVRLPQTHPTTDKIHNARTHTHARTAKQENSASAE